MPFNESVAVSGNGTAAPPSSSHSSMALPIRRFICDAFSIGCLPAPVSARRAIDHDERMG